MSAIRKKVENCWFRRKAKTGRCLKDNEKVNHRRMLWEHRREELIPSSGGVGSFLGEAITELNLPGTGKGQSRGAVCKDTVVRHRGAP